MNRAVLLSLAAAVATPAFAWAPSNQYGATWPTAVNWKMNNGGSSSISNINTVESILGTAYDEWESPTCSGFVDNYTGRTSKQSSSNGDGANTHGFLSGWPRQYGDPYSVIGICNTRFSGRGGNWDIVEADVSFNEAVYTFVQGNPGRGYSADLESIAVHEFGHSLGLGHTPVNGATMYPSYDNGTATRSLANDDIDGVCTLYPNGTTLPTEDDYEPNDDPNAASEVACGVRIEAAGTDADWYVVSPGSTGDIDAELTWSSGNADLDLYLFRVVGNQLDELDKSESSSGTSESVSSGSQPAGDYYIYVVPYQGNGDDYVLEIGCGGQAGGTVGGGGNNGGGANNGGGNNGGGNQGGGIGTEDGYEQNDAPTDAAALNCPGIHNLHAANQDQDWFQFSTGGRGDISVELSWTDSSADLDVYLADVSSWAVVAGSEEEGSGPESFDYPDAAAGDYIVGVNPYSGSSDYKLTLRCEANGELPEPGDTAGDTGGGGGLNANGGGGDGEGEVVAGCACNGTGAPVGFGIWMLGLGVLAIRRRD